MKLKYMFLLLFGISILSYSFGINLGSLEITEDNSSAYVSFNIDKHENYTYKLDFIHYGNINNNMSINMYLNGELIYKIDGSNNAFPGNPKDISLNIGQYIINGKNTLKIEGVNIIGNDTYHPYYVLNDIHINNPPNKTPISIGLIVSTLLAVGLIIYRYGSFSQDE